MASTQLVQVCHLASTSVSGPDGDLFQQTAKVLTLTSFYEESFQHEFGFVSNCDAHECLNSGAVSRALEAHSRLALLTGLVAVYWFHVLTLQLTAGWQFTEAVWV